MASIAEKIAKDIIEGREFRSLEDASAAPQAGYEIQFEMAPIVAEAKGGVGGRKIAWNAPALMQKLGWRRREPLMFSEMISAGATRT